MRRVKKEAEIYLSLELSVLNMNTSANVLNQQMASAVTVFN